MAHYYYSLDIVTCLKISFDQLVSSLSVSKCFEISSFICSAVLSISSSSCNIKHEIAIFFQVQILSFSNFSFGLSLICKYIHINANVFFDTALKNWCGKNFYKLHVFILNVWIELPDRFLIVRVDRCRGKFRIATFGQFFHLSGNRSRFRQPLITRRHLLKFHEENRKLFFIEHFRKHFRSKTVLFLLRKFWCALYDWTTFPVMSHNLWLNYHLIFPL